jgi:hypothetical protein
VRIQWRQNPIQNHDDAEQEFAANAMNPDQYVMSLIEKIRADLDSKGLLERAEAIVPVDPWQANLSVRQGNSSQFYEVYGSITFEIFGEGDPVWDFWEKLFPNSPACTWKCIAMGHMGVQYFHVYALLLKHGALTPELSGWFRDEREWLKSLKSPLERQLDASFQEPA